MYNRKNILRRILWVQEVTLEHTRKGVTQQWIYDNIIYPRFSVSIRTYYNYLGTNAKAEMRKLQPETKTQAVQMSMF